MVIGFHSQTVVRILQELGEIAEHARKDPQRKEMTVGIQFIQRILPQKRNDCGPFFARSLQQLALAFLPSALPLPEWWV